MRRHSLLINRIILAYVDRPNQACSMKVNPLYQIPDLVGYVLAKIPMLIWMM